MAEKIIIEAEKVWEYFQTNKNTLKDKMHCIAEHKEYGVEIFVTEDSDLPLIIVEADGISVYEECILCENDCCETVNEVYSTYLTDKIIDKMLGDSGTDEEDINDMEIEQREDELSTAVFDCIDVFCDGVLEYYEEMDEICEDVKDLIGEYLYLKWGLQPRRPMVLEFDDGSESFEEYPYSLMVLENEHNPLFK